MLLLFSVRLQLKVENNVFPSIGHQILCQLMKYRGITLQRLLLVNDILVGLVRVLDYAGVGLERFNCTCNWKGYKTPFCRYGHLCSRPSPGGNMLTCWVALYLLVYITCIYRAVNQLCTVDPGLHSSIIT